MMQFMHWENMFNFKGKNRTGVVNMGACSSESLKTFKEKWEGSIHSLENDIS